MSRNCRNEKTVWSQNLSLLGLPGEVIQLSNRFCCTVSRFAEAYHPYIGPNAESEYAIHHKLHVDLGDSPAGELIGSVCVVQYMLADDYETDIHAVKSHREMGALCDVTSICQRAKPMGEGAVAAASALFDSKAGLKAMQAHLHEVMLKRSNRIASNRAVMAANVSTISIMVGWF